MKPLFAARFFWYTLCILMKWTVAGFPAPFCDQCCTKTNS